MRPIPSKVVDRLTAAIKKFQRILELAKSKDINESDTVVIVTDMLSEVFGYEKYSEITSEFSIKSTYCDLATRIDGSLQYLIEVKSVDTELKDQFVKQAVDYAANQGTDWVLLTNGIKWNIYKISFGKPIEQELVAEFDFLSLNAKDKSHLEILFCISREGCTKSVLSDYHSRKQVLSKYFIGNIILTEPILNAIRKELKKLEPDVKTDLVQIELIIRQEIFKRELLDSEKSADAKKKINRTLNKQKRAKEKLTNSPDSGLIVTSAEQKVDVINNNSTGNKSE